MNADIKFEMSSKIDTKFEHALNNDNFKVRITSNTKSARKTLREVLQLFGFGVDG